MDYTPGICATVRDNCDARRDMTVDEAQAAYTWLTARCAQAGLR
jgi:hypothetical protein